jgi:hypothetical protein
MRAMEKLMRYRMRIVTIPTDGPRVFHDSVLHPWAMAFFIMSRKWERSTDVVDKLTHASIADITVLMDDVVCMLLCKAKAVIWEFSKGKSKESTFGL